MAIDPRLGYDPGINAPSAYGVRTVDQYVANLAATWHLQYTNGQDMVGSIFSNDWPNVLRHEWFDVYIAAGVAP